MVIYETPRLFMKVLVLAEGLGPSDARGIEIISENITQLAKLGVDVTVITTRNHLIDKHQFDLWKQDKERMGIKINMIDDSWLASKHQHLSIWVSKIPTFIKAISLGFAEKYDIFHEYSSSPLLYLRTFLISKLIGCKSVHTIITYNDTIWAKPFLATIGRLLDVMIFPSLAFAKKYQRYVDIKKMFVISQGVDTTKFHQTEICKKKAFLYLGPLEKNKGIFLLIKAASDLLKEHKEVSFLFVTHRKIFTKQYTDSLKEIKKLNFQVTDSLVNVPRLIESVRIMVLPQLSHHGTLVYPQTLLEAMACGKIVIAPKTPEILELIEDNQTGILFVPGETASLSLALERSLSAPDSMGLRAAQQIRDHHDLVGQVKKLLKVYQALCVKE